MVLNYIPSLWIVFIIPIQLFRNNIQLWFYIQLFLMLLKYLIKKKINKKNYTQILKQMSISWTKKINAIEKKNTE